MLSKSLSTSEKFAALIDRTPLAEFCHALYPLLIVHTDDFGRLQGDPFTVKHQCYPISKRSLDEFADALRELHEIELVIWYEVAGKKYLQIVKFDPHQQGLHRRTASSIPSPEGQPGKAPRRTVSAMDASEKQIEDWIVRLLKKQSLVFSGLTIANVDQQVRRGASYIDILATTIEGPILLIELKRQRVTDAAIAQARKYADLVAGEVIPVVIGHGLAVGEQLPKDVLVATYDDRYRVTPVTSFRAKSREVTLTHVAPEKKRREENGTEEKRAIARTRGHGSGAMAGGLPREHRDHVMCDPTFTVCVPAAVHDKLTNLLSRRYAGDRQKAGDALKAWYPTIWPALSADFVMGDAFKFWQSRFDAAFATKEGKPAESRPNVPSADATAQYLAGQRKL